MMSRHHLLPALVLLLGACSSTPRGTRTNSSAAVITSAELGAATETSLYDVVAVHRPRWLQPRQGGGIPSRGAPLAVGGGVSVYLNQARAGGLEVLRTLSRDAATGLRFYDVTEAQQRFPNRETGAVIQVLMK